MISSFDLDQEKTPDPFSPAHRDFAELFEGGFDVFDDFLI